MNILCDIDGVLAQFTEHFSHYCCDRGYMYRVKDFDTYGLKDVLKKEDHWLLAAAAGNKDWCWSVPRYDGAQQFLKDLVADGHRIHLVTAPWQGPYWEEARTKWVESLLSSPELKEVTWQFATSEERVQMWADVLIDDRPGTMRAWRDTDRLGFLMDRPWNQGFTSGRRVSSYKDILDLL